MTKALKRILILFLVGCCAAGRGVAYDPFFLSLRLYEYHPEVFADRWIGNLPENPRIPVSAEPGRIWYIQLRDPSYTFHFDTLTAMITERNIPGVDFSGLRNFSDEDIRKLAAATGIWPIIPGHEHRWRLLKLQGTMVSDRATQYISAMRDLEMLSYNDQLSDDGLERLGGLSRLEELGLAGTQITDRGMATLSAFPALERLDIGDTAVTDAGLRALTKLHLKQLRLGKNIHDAGLAAILAGSAPIQLDLAETGVSDAGVAMLGKDKALRTLFVGPSVSDAGIARLPGLLQRLDLSGAHLTDISVGSIARLKYLEELALSQTDITDAALPLLKVLPRLRYLELSDTAVTESGLAGLKGYKSLEVLSISTQHPLSLNKLLPLGSLPKLRVLIVNGRLVDRSVIDYLKAHAVAHAWEVDFLSTWAIAEPGAVDEASAQQALADASAPSGGIAFHGLRRIHEAESELRDVISAPPTIGQDNQQDTNQNFLGEFSVGVPARKKGAK